jgi:two-component system response regulator BaeR
MMRILIVEDEIELGEIVQDYLRAQDFETLLVNDGIEALQKIVHEYWDLVLLDLMLPGKDGLSVCQEARKITQVPIIMMTAKVEEIDRLLGLELGADDYICKPYSPRELVARVKAVLRRTRPAEDETHFYLDQTNLSVNFQGQNIEVTAVEYRLLDILLSNRNRVISRDHLKKHAYNDHRVVNDRTMDSHITKLRKKLLQLTPEEFIHSVYGVGYKLQIPSA